MIQIAIDRGNASDKQEIQDLMDSLNTYRNKNFAKETEEFHNRINPYKSLQDDDFHESIFFVAKDESTNIIGFIQGSIHQRKNHKLHTLGYIDELFVQEDFRGQGIARNLFTKLENEFRKQGCDHITTHTDIENTLSQKFYGEAGMKKVTIELWKKL